MEKHDLEQFYWFTVSDSAELLAHANVDIETFLGDVFDSLLKSKPTAGNLVPLLAVLDKLNEERQRLNAEALKSEIFKA